MSRIYQIVVSLLVLGVGVGVVLPASWIQSQSAPTKQKTPAQVRVPLTWAQFVQ